MPNSATLTRPPVRDRLLAFAFAGADLLIETGAHETITWAAGAFVSRFGVPADSFLGRGLADLIAPADRAALSGVLAGVAARGRMAPVVLHLADPANSACTLAALALPGDRSRICVTIGQVPIPAPPPIAALQDAAAFARETETRLRAGQPGSLGLLDVTGWEETSATLSGEERQMLRSGIGTVLAGMDGNLVSEVAAGRFSVLSQNEIDLSRLTAAVEALIRAAGGGHGATVEGQLIGLSQQGLTAPQAVRALRFALARFTEGGMAATARAGFGGGLTGFILQAGAQAQLIRAAIAQHRFHLAFQPVVTLDGRKIHHYEALLRPILTPASPVRTTQDFVTFSEAVGLSEELDLAVLAQTLAALRDAAGAVIAVNISGMSMQSPAFRDRLLREIDDRAAGRLMIELTETTEIEDVAGAAATLDRLRELGVPVCIDDFGAGAASFRYLRDFHVDYIKIDGGYVRAATNSGRECGFIASMRDLAHAVGAQVIAEMTETEQTASLMADLGVRFGQGWLFGKPGALPGHIGQHHRHHA
jgi:EAL domain-containing protein (putative c-di-GMP-specific phosphodiesterase class I)